MIKYLLIFVLLVHQLLSVGWSDKWEPDSPVLCINSIGHVAVELNDNTDYNKSLKRNIGFCLDIPILSSVVVFANISTFNANQDINPLVLPGERNNLLDFLLKLDSLSYPELLVENPFHSSYSYTTTSFVLKVLSTIIIVC